MPDRSRHHTLLWSVVGVLGMLAVIVLLGVIKGPDGQPLLDPEGAFSQVIMTAGLIAVALIPTLRRTQKDAAAAKEDAAVAREHVANDHVDDEGKPINLRTDLDDFRTEMRDLVVDGLAAMREHTDTQFDGVRSDMRGIRRDVGRNTDGVERARIRQDAHEKYSRRVVARLEQKIRNIADAVDLEDTTPTPPKEAPPS